MGIEALYKAFLKYPKISTDTRNIHQDSIFFALKGATFNGNAFAREALEKGAALAVIDEDPDHTDERFIQVNDVLSALQELAHHHRKQFNIPVIGITGSNGKTTTKELINNVLSQQFRTYATKGNLNNHIGVPLSLLEIHEETEIAIIEMGANHLGEIRNLCRIAAPDYGLITNIGKAHLEGFGSLEGVIKAKGELYDWIAENKGTLFLQADNPILSRMAGERAIQKCFTYGESPVHQVSGQAFRSDPYLSLRWRRGSESFDVDTQITGSYNTENVLAAICVGLYFKLSPETINTGIQTYRPSNNRSQIIQTKHNTVICDYYNANVNSMSAAIDNFKGLEGQSKVIILGDMFELGETADQEHAILIKKALEVPADQYIFVGQHFYKHRTHIAPGILFYETTEDAQKALKANAPKAALILLKASRGMAFETLLEFL